MEYFELTPEIMKKAKTYMPLNQKTVLAETIARMSLKPIKPLNEKDSIDNLLVVPSVVGEDNYKKECMLLNTLLSYYFDIKVPQMDAKLYDKYMGNHLLNQLERYKGNAEYKTKSFDILTDFKTIKRMVDAEIYNIKTKENDLLERFLKGIGLFSAEKMTNNPEYLQKLTEEIKKFAEVEKQKEVVAENTTTVAESTTVEE